MRAHPFHLHVNHFQIVEINLDDSIDYFKIGDWHDTLYAPSNFATIRFFSDYFVGNMLLNYIVNL